MSESRNETLSQRREAAHPGAEQWQPTAEWPAVRLRADLLRRARDFFYEHQFLEVETPLLSSETIVDAELEPIAVNIGENEETFWLQTSPELCMKRLLSAGADAIFQITRGFRKEESGPLHNPEFTLMEWYRTGDGMEEGMGLLSDLFQRLMQTDPAKRLSYRDAFLEYAQIDPFEAEPAAYAQIATANGLAVPAQLGDEIDDWRNLLLLELVMPHLGQSEPVILFNYPASQAALAEIRNDPHPVAERFELFYQGIELANGYHELRDPHELRRRTEEANRQRVAQGKRPLPPSRRLEAAMREGFPRAAGVALGVDRLVLLAAGKKELADVMTFPINRA